MQNLQTMWLPRPAGDGTFVMANIFDPSDKVPMIDIADDMGKFVLPILLNPVDGEFFAAAESFYSFEEISQTISTVTGKTVKYKQVPDDVFKNFYHGTWLHKWWRCFNSSATLVTMDPIK